MYYAWSPYRDAWRKYKDHNRLKQAAKNAEEIREGVYLGAQALVFDEIQKIAGTGDYREFAAILDRAMKEWKILSEECGLVDGKLISDTKELVFDPAHARFVIHTPYCGYFSGSPAESLRLSEKLRSSQKMSGLRWHFFQWERKTGAGRGICDHCDGNNGNGQDNVSGRCTDDGLSVYCSTLSWKIICRNAGRKNLRKS